MDPFERRLSWQGTDEELDAVNAVLRTAATIGILASATIIFSFFRFRLLKTKSGTLIIMLAICDVGSNISDMFGAGNTTGSAACVIQGIWSQIFDMASILYSFLISYVLWWNVVQISTNGRKALVASSLRNMQIFIFVFAIFLALLPLITNSYGEAGPWCWIKASDDKVVEGNIWRFSIFYAPLWICFIFICYFYFDIHRAVMRHASFGSSSKLEKFSQKLKYYPLVFLAAWTLAFSLRIHNWVTDDSYNFELLILQSSIGNGSFIQAIGNALVYGYTPLVREHWLELKEEIAQKKSCAPLCRFSEAGDDVEDDDLGGDDEANGETEEQATQMTAPKTEV